MKKKIILTLILLATILTSCTLTTFQEKEITSTTTPIIQPTNTSSPEPIKYPSYPNQDSGPDDGVINDPFAPELGNDGYDTTHYDIAISLDPNKTFEILAASATITLTITHPSNEIILDFAGYEISNIFLVEENASLSFLRKNEKLIITLPTTHQPNSELTLQIDYAGFAQIEASRYIDFAPSVGFFYPDGEHLFIASEPDGARYWMPCNDHPQDKATYTFSITTPETMRGIANGKLLEEIQNTDGTKTYTYAHKNPMASYLATIIVGDFEHMIQKDVNGTQINVYAPKEYKEIVNTFDPILIESMEWMSEKFGPYPFESIGYVIINATGFSLETQTMILMDDQMLDQRTLVHEISHMWFGDSVSIASWHEIWRNEGFATFTHTYYPIKDEGDIAIQETFEDIRDWMEADYGDFDLDSPPEGDLFHIAEYFKAAIVVYDLMHFMGEDAFYHGIQTYMQTYQGGTATDEDFWEIMETTSGIEMDEFIIANFEE